jgi:hypothetical protein
MVNTKAVVVNIMYTFVVDKFLISKILFKVIIFGYSKF